MWQCDIHRPVARMKPETSNGLDEKPWVSHVIQQIRTQVSHNIIL